MTVGYRRPDYRPVYARCVSAVAGVFTFERILIFSLLFFGAFLAMHAAEAASSETFTDVARHVRQNTRLLPNFIVYLCYVCGVAFAMWGLLDARQYVEKPDQRPLRHALVKIGIGGLLLFVPYIVDVVYTTLSDDFLENLDIVSVYIEKFDNILKGAKGKGGFWDLMVHINKETKIITNVFSYASYIAGTALTAYGLFGLRRSGEDLGRNPLRAPLGQLFGGAALIGLPYLFEVVQDTMAYGVEDTKPQYVPGGYRFNASNAEETVGSIIKNVRSNAEILPNFFVFVAFAIGTFFLIRGVLMLRDHANDGRTPIMDPIKRLGVAGLLFAVPFISDVVINTLALYDNAGNNDSGWKTPGGGTGLDGMFMALAKNTVNPLIQATEVFCYIAGILMVVFGVQRLVQNAQAGVKSPLGFGTISMFIVAAALMAFPHTVGTFVTTVFGSPDAMTKITFLSVNNLIDPDLQKNAESIISACVAFIGVIGFISIVRGLFIFKAYADGGQGTLFSAVTHMIAGTIAVNLGQFVNFIQNSLGLDTTTYGITFG